MMGFLAISSMNAQTIPNSSFENWSTKSLAPQPKLWVTLNPEFQAATGKPSVIKSSDAVSGKFSAKIMGSDKGLPSILLLGDSFSLKGVPYTSKPDSLNFHFKSNLAMGDTAEIDIVFKKSGIPIGLNLKTVLSSHSSWIDTSIALSCFFKPDSVICAINMTKVKAGHFLQIDNFKLIGTSVNQLGNNDFENWDSASTEEADGWYGLNDLAVGTGNNPVLTKSTDARTGNFAMQVKTESVNILGSKTTIGFATTGSLSTGRMLGGFPASTRPGKFTFYYKYTPAKSGDTANVGVWIRHKGVTLDSTVAHLLPASTYTQFDLTIPNIAANIPDTVNIVFSSSNFDGKDKYKSPIYAGSTLVVDDLSFSTVSGIENELSSNGIVNIFPNPSNGNFYLGCMKDDAEPMDFILCNATGQEVFRQKLNIGSMDKQAYLIETGKLGNGVYFYFLRNDKGMKTGKLVIE